MKTERLKTFGQSPLQKNLSVFALMCSVSFAAVAQEQSQAEEKPSEQAVAQAEEKPKAETYFVGSKPALKRQTGPALGKPTSILPAPYIAGAIPIPAPVVENTENENPAEEAVEVQETALLDADMPQEDIEGDPLEAEAQDTLDVANITDEFETEAIEEGALATLDPSGLSALEGAQFSGDGFAADMWQGVGRADLIDAFSALEGLGRTSVNRHILRKLALSELALNAPETDGDVDAMIKARLSLLASIGDAAGFSALVAALPRDRDWSALAREITDAYLINGQLADACVMAANQRVIETSAHWLRLNAFCAATAANRTTVDFELGILEEVTTIEPAFYQLIDQVLIESEQATGSVVAEGVALETPLKVTLLNAAMARIARVSVPLFDMETVDPLAAGIMLGLNRLDRDASISLLKYGLEKGLYTPSVIKTFLSTVPLTDAERLAASMPQAGEGAENADSDSEDYMFENEADAAFHRAILNTRMAVDAADNAQRKKYLTRAYSNAYQHPLVMGLFAAIATEKPTGDNVDLAELGLRLGLLSGDRPLAHQWWQALRSSQAGENAGADEALKRAWPLAHVVHSKTAPDMNADSIAIWWGAVSKDEDRYAKANMLFSLLEAVDRPVPAGAWAVLEDGPTHMGAVPATNPAVWRAMLLDARNGNKLGLLKNAVRLLAMENGEQPSIAVVSSVIGHLHAAGFGADARRMAYTALLHAGF